LTGCLALPEGLTIHVSENGCLPDGTCPYGGKAPATFYWAPTRTIVAAPNQGKSTLAHEACHAHQHEMILEDLGHEPSNVDLRDWYETAEGKSFVETTGWKSTSVSGQPPTWTGSHPWSYLSNANPIEDFANTCSRFLVDPQGLTGLDPVRSAWAQEHLQ
jgi:hypothetical protein